MVDRDAQAQRCNSRRRRRGRRSCGRWLAHLGAERRMSPKTVEAYERDVRQFLGFLTGTPANR